MKEVIDYAVIGGGIGGAYSAWRLKQAFPDKKVVLFEYSSRIGGRLFTRKLPGIDDASAELGGMRYIPDSQPIITKLIDHLGLHHRDFPMGDPKDDPNGLNNYIYFRNRHFTVGEMGDAAKVPYHVDWSERGRTPDQLQSQVLKTLVPNYANLSLDEWFEVKVFGKPLYEYGFWNLLYRVLSPEAFEYLRMGSGYDTNVSNGNSITLLPTGGEYSSVTPYKTVIDGMEAIPITLANQFEGEFKGDIRRNYRLASIIKTEEGQYALRFFRTQTNGSHTGDVEPAEVHELRAEHVILAMPRRSLELIEWEQFHKNPFLKENIPSVLIQSAFKLWLAYPYAWWKSLGLVAGRSMTDLPIRQTFYFTSPDDMDLSKPATTPSLLMATYNDITTVPFWKGLEEGECIPGPDDARASIQMVQEAHRQVLELHDQRKLPEPYAAAYIDWGQEPYGGAWHSWKAGFKYNEIMPKMCHPVEDEKVYICGEAYSNDQGWAEGALETAEDMLSRVLKIPTHKFLAGEKNVTDPLKRVAITLLARSKMPGGQP